MDKAKIRRAIQRELRYRKNTANKTVKIRR